MVVALESLLSGSEGGGLNGDSLLDSVLLLPNIELPNTEVGLGAASEVPNGLVGLAMAKKFGALPEPRLGAVEVGRDEPADEAPVSKGAANEMLEVGGGFDVAADAFEEANAKADFGGSGRVVDEDANDSLGLGVKPKGDCVGAEPEGGTNGWNVKSPVFVPLSLAEGNLGDASADPIGGFGMVNSEAVFSGGALTPKMGAELAVTGPRTVDGCEESSNSD